MGRTTETAAIKRGRRSSKSKSGRGGRKAQRRREPQDRSRIGGNNSVARPGSKLAAVIAMLQRPKGASIAELCKVTGWQAHSVRGALSGTIKKRMRLPVVSAKSGGLRRYRLAK